ncbi:MAG: periplasmic heavy metal sensor [Ignavibacteriales bacterium]|nr:periplasmic heavy metal sensor [Ignavibacteriales bacterium]
MKRSIGVVVFIVATTVAVWSQEKMRRNQGMEMDFFPPELLMENQKALGLTEDQKNAIKAEIQKAQSTFTDVQWQMKTEAESMEEILKNDKVDEQQALAQLEKVINLERKMKITQVTMMLRIKNKLSAEQQRKLRELRERKVKMKYDEGEEREMKEREMRERREMLEHEMLEKPQMEESQKREKKKGDMKEQEE